MVVIRSPSSQLVPFRLHRFGKQRPLPSSYEVSKPYFKYEIIKPIPEIPKSNILPWFGQKGTGTQYELPKQVQWYLDNNYLRKVDK
ncbi:TNT domain-containing protein [Aeromonas rivipollensis]|uniref:TNT domain-containing protein n=1 Tax=Aeromonas TaxID=642 RepID=UPI001118D541|nr:hypothetical protein CF122_01600 [Aeromonas media]